MQDYKDDFTFLNEPQGKPLPSDTLTGGPNLQQVAKMSPRQLANSILNVYNRLGGDAWLLAQAVVDPKGFMDLLKKILPNNIKLDGLENISIRLVDRYGNDLADRSVGTPTSSPQLPTTDDDVIEIESAASNALPAVEVQDRFEEVPAVRPHQSPSELTASEGLDFNFV